MYSPKISEDLIPELYKVSKEVNKPMTKVVNDILKNYITIYKKYQDIPHITMKNMLENLLERENLFNLR